MASVNGVSLKAIKTFEGAEGMGFTANIYIDGKKVGFVRDDAWGGSYDYDFSNDDGEKLLTARAKEWYDRYPEDDFMFVMKLTAEEYRKKKDAGEIPVESWEEQLEYNDCFLSKIIDLVQAEKAYKGAVKKGFKGYVVFTHPHISGPIPLEKGYFIYAREQADELLTDIRKAHLAYNMDYCFMDPKDFVMTL